MGFDYKVVVAALFAGFALVELFTGRLLQRDKTTAKDVILDTASAIVLPVVTVPFILWASAQLTEAALPGRAQSLAHLSPVAMFAILLIADDLTQYAWHRLSHSVTWLYGFHRAHHSASFMSVRIVYRNNLFYYLLMPGLWSSGVLLYLGFEKVYAVYFGLKMLVIIGAHSNVPWDEAVWRVRPLRPLMWLLTRIISTPRTHSAHHGKHASDGVTHYKGNFGNFLFFWDVLFGTAKIPAHRPTVFGLENEAPRTWFQELVWPSPAD